MKYLTCLILVLFSASFIFSETSDMNPDGKIGSYIITLGGSFGYGSLTDKYGSGAVLEKSNVSSYSFLCKTELPMSKKTTCILQVEYLRDKMGTAGIYEGITKSFRMGIYLKFFSK